MADTAPFTLKVKCKLRLTEPDTLAGTIETTDCTTDSINADLKEMAKREVGAKTGFSLSKFAVRE